MKLRKNEILINFSVIIIDKNIEDKLPDILKSLFIFKHSGGEVCLLDLGSDDETIVIASKWGCKIKSVNFTKSIDSETYKSVNEFFQKDEKEIIKVGDQYINFSEVKNYATSLSTNDMVLIIDGNCSIINFDYNQIMLLIKDNYTKFDTLEEHFDFYNRKKYVWKNNYLIIKDNENLKEDLIINSILNIKSKKSNSDKLIPLAIDCYLNPSDNKISQSFAIELINHNFLTSAYHEFKRHLSLIDSKPESSLERSISLIYIGDYFSLINNKNEAVSYYNKAYEEYPNRRLPLYKIGLIYYIDKVWDKCIFYLEGCLNIKTFNPVIDDELHYGEGPYSMLYVAYWWFGDKEKSKYYIDMALKENPYNKLYLSESKFHYEYESSDIIGNLSFKETQYLYNESKKYNSILEINPFNDRGTHALLNGCKGIVTVVTNNNLKNVESYGNLRIIKDKNEIKTEKFDMLIINCEGISDNDIKDTILEWEFNANYLICGYNYKINKKAVDETIEISGVEDNIWFKELSQFQKQIIYKRKVESKPKNKKLAICISGYLRTFKECYPSILKNVIQDNDCDIFIHTYDKIGNSSGWRSPIDLSENIDMNFLESIPNIKVVAIEKWDDIKYQFEKFKKLQPYVTNINVISTIFYKIHQCNELRKQYEKENNISYDLIVRMRGDQIFEKKINLNFPENKILINAYPWGDEDYVEHYQMKDNDGNIILEHENNCLNDRFAIGNSSNIDFLSDLYNHFEELITDTPCVELEYLLFKYLNNKIELEKKNLNFYVKHNPPRLVKHH